MVYDLDVRTGRVNSLNGLQGLLGYELSASDATLEWWDRQIHPDDLAMCHDAFALTLSDGKDQVLQYRVRHKDDRELWVDDHATVLRDSRGEIVRMVGTVVDITARKQAEVALRQSHAFVQSTIDALSSHICVLDQTGTIIAVNRAWRDFDEANRRADGDERDSASTPEGGNRAPINYLDVCEATVGADAADARKVAAGIRAILQGASQHFSLEYPCHSPAEQHWFLCRVTPYAGDGVPRIVRILALITAESELKQRTILNCLKAMAESGGLDLQFPRSCGQKLPHTDMGPLPCESKRQDYAHEMELMPQSAYSGSPIAVPRGNNAEWLFPPQKNATSREIGKCM